MARQKPTTQQLEDFSGRLRRVMAIHKLTQSELARRLYSRAGKQSHDGPVEKRQIEALRGKVNRWCRGKALPDRSGLRMLGSILGMSVSWLDMERASPSEPPPHWAINCYFEILDDNARAMKEGSVEPGLSLTSGRSGTAVMRSAPASVREILSRHLEQQIDHGRDKSSFGNEISEPTDAQVAAACLRATFTSRHARIRCHLPAGGVLLIVWLLDNFSRRLQHTPVVTDLRLRALAKDCLLAFHGSDAMPREAADRTGNEIERVEDEVGNLVASVMDSIAQLSLGSPEAEELEKFIFSDAHS